MEISQRVVLLTGASSGIGRELACQLAAHGCELILLARREDRLRQLCSDLGERARYCVVDLAEAEQISGFVQENREILQRVNVLVNNAGLALGVAPFSEGALTDYDRMLDVNVRALIHLTRHLLPHMRQHSVADIVNLGSVAGRWVYPGGAIYCATKFAVRALSEGLRHDLVGSGVRVCNIEPGMVETEFSQVRLGSEEAASDVYRGMRPLTGQDIAECVVWSLSRPAHVNIQEMVVFPTDQSGVSRVHRRE